MYFSDSNGIRASLAKWLSVRLRTISGCGFESSCCHLNFRHGARYVSSKEFLDIQATIECRFTLKLVRDIIITYNVF